MNLEGLRQIVADVFGANTKTEVVNGWLSMRCPLAPWKHTSGKDSRPSSGISIKDHDTSVFNCLRGGTEVRTYRGTRPIADLAGTVQILQLPNGGWVHAPIKSFGEQKLYKVSLSRNGRKKEVYATAGHRWFSQSAGGGNYLERTTLELQPKQRMQSVAIATPSAYTFDETAILHGVVFGDGTAHINGRHGRVNLYGEKAQLYRRLARAATDAGTTNEGVPYVSGEYAKFKKLPSRTGLPYLLGFVAGWIAADGGIDARGNVSLSSADEGDLEWLRDLLYAQGIETYDISEQWIDGYGNTPTSIYTLRFVSATIHESLFIREDQRSRFATGTSKAYARWQWQVVSVEETDIVEEVFCAVVAKYHAFVLDGGLVTGNCYTCHTKVPLQALIRQYADFTGEDLDDLIEELEDEAYLGPRQLPSWEAMRAGTSTAEAPTISKELHLDLYDPAAGHWYLRKRGISDETANKLELKVDPGDSEGEERILFPVFSPAGDLHGFSGRAINPAARLKVRDYAGLPKAMCLLGAHLIAQERPDKLLIVEGLFDYANGWEQGYPCAAVMHSTFTPAQAAIVRDIGLPTYLFYDDDDAGHSGMRIAGDQLVQYQPVMRIRYPDIWIEDPTEPDGGHWVKDPGELLAEDFEEMIRDSRLF